MRRGTHNACATNSTNRLIRQTDFLVKVDLFVVVLKDAKGHVCAHLLIVAKPIFVPEIVVVTQVNCVMTGIK